MSKRMVDFEAFPYYNCLIYDEALYFNCGDECVKCVMNQSVFLK